MAIIIPSKNIYEINNQKVVDNEVDNIEITAKNVIPDNHYNESVYNKRIPVIPKDETTFQDYNTDGYKAVLGLDDIQNSKIYHAVACLKVTPIYSEVIVNIPIYKDDTHIIDSVFYGKDKNGKNNIGVSIVGKIKQGRANAFLDYVAAKYTESNTFDKSRYTINWGTIQYSVPEKEESKTYELTTEALNDVTGPQNVLSPSQESDVNENGAIYLYNAVPSNITPAPEDPTGAVAKELHTSIIYKIEDLGNVATQKIKPTTDGYSVRLRMLSGIRILRLDSIFDSFDYSIAFGEYQGNASKKNVPLTGRYVEYEPSDVEVTILGNTIGISLQDETVKIGDGQHVYSFDGNELMQTSNTPSIEENYNKVINGWKNGKEIATIKCGIANYYENQEEITPINIYIVAYGFPVLYFRVGSKFAEDYPVFINDKIQIGENIFVVEQKNVQYGSTGTFATLARFVSGDAFLGVGIAGQTLEANLIHPSPKRISVNKKGDYPQYNDLPITFSVGDSVIPYIKGADGNDKPMSLYMDKTTPKEFLVIGNRIIADGQILQELTLQEIPQKLN